MADLNVAVPNVLGVPPLNFAVGFEAGLALLITDGVPLFPGFGPQWGIFLGGVPVVLADTVTSVEYKQEWLLSDYPLEQGAFETYDKVAVPYDARVRFVAGGSAVARQALLDSVAAIAGDLNFYDVITPEQIYVSANVTHYDYRRTAINGVGLIAVDVWLLEVRVSTDNLSGLSNTQAPSGTSPTNGGTVQPTAPTSAEAAHIPTIFNNGGQTAAPQFTAIPSQFNIGA